MAKAPFAKPALSPPALLAKLKGQGLVINAADEPKALAYLEFNGGHRLKGYWWRSIDPATKKFRPGQDTFVYLAQQIEFDRQIRALLWPAIELVELSVRSSMANYLSLHHSPHWFLTPSIFQPTEAWGLGAFLKKIEDEVKRSKVRRPVAHYFATYDDPYLPPSWVISECVTLGTWSRLYAALRDPIDRKAIARRFDVHQPEVFESWLHTVTYLRNVVAHHGQVLGVTLRIAPSNYKGHKGSAGSGLSLGPQNSSLHAAAKLLNYLLVRSGLPQSLKADLQQLMSAYPGSFAAMAGFPAGWETSAAGSRSWTGLPLLTAGNRACMKQKLLLALPDYQRIYQVIYTVLEASGIATTHRACFFFAWAGAGILREHYGLQASVSTGGFALMTEERKRTIAVFGRLVGEGDDLGCDTDAFHAWVECDGWLLDFMAPIIGVAMREDGQPEAPRWMLQKPLSEGKASPRSIQHAGEFFAWHDESLARQIFDLQPLAFGDLIETCLAWYRKPPRLLPEVALASDDGSNRKLTLRAPAIVGRW